MLTSIIQHYAGRVVFARPTYVNLLGQLLAGLDACFAVNALDNALRKDIGPYAPIIEDLHLVDYKVRILDGGTGAVTRVLIESADGNGERWFTVGVSANIVDASYQALMDSIVYKLYRDGADETLAAD